MKLIKSIGYTLFIMLVTLQSFAKLPNKTVYISFQLNDIKKIYIQEEIIELNGTLTLEWQSDERPGKTIYFKNGQVDKYFEDKWMPNLIIFETRSPWVSLAKSAQIKQDGWVSFQEIFDAQIKTKFNVKKFPFDNQNLKFVFLEFGYTPYYVKFSPLLNESKIGHEAHLNGWRLIGTSQGTHPGKGSDHYTFDVRYERESQPYIYKIFFPLLIIIMLSFSMLWLTKEPAINRIAVVITSLLSTLAFQWIVMSTTPNVSYVTFMQAILITTLLSIGMVGLILVIVANLTSRKYIRIMNTSRYVLPFMFLFVVILLTVSYL